MKSRVLLSLVAILAATGLQSQTGGPAQPEFMQFQQAGTENLVNPATGTFSYQIPLFTIGGYPMNLTYQSGIMMEDVASMVGLGWNLNAGTIVRTLRGIADDAKKGTTDANSDIMVKEFTVKENRTFGGKVAVDLEIAGLSDVIGLSVGAELGVFYNNYKGWGLEPALRGSLSACYQSNSGTGGTASLGMGVAVNSQSGVDKYINPSLGFKLGKGLSVSLGKTWSVNSIQGLRSSINTSMSYSRYNEGTRKGVRSGKKGEFPDQSSFSLLGYGNQSYLNNSYNPDIDYPFLNLSGTYSGTLGLDAFYVDPGFRITGYFSVQKLDITSQRFYLMGTMYESESMPLNALMDFNREKKLPYFFGESPVLPIPYRTPDLFNLNAQGLSMTFSVNKNDIGVMGDARAIVESNGTQAGLEVNAGNLTKAGLNYGTTTAYQMSMRWNPTKIKFEIDQQIFNDELYHQFCLKNHGEINRFNHSAFFRMGGYEPLQFPVADEASISKPGTFTAQTNPMFSNVVNTKQPVCQSTISYLDADEASVMGLDKKIKYYTFSGSATSPLELNRTGGYRKKHHLSEFTVTQPDGMKYVFGIPVYNTRQHEATFNVGAVGPGPSAAHVDPVKNLVTYVPNADNSVNNEKGIDWFFEATSTPAYATTFLITAVLSPDYRDLTGDGISVDDVGNYVRFNYYLEDYGQGVSNDGYTYRWRTPVGLNQATYSQGLRSDALDDKGSYVYGEKELWYIHSMESKTERALFYYSQRTDGFGVQGENGGVDQNNYLRKLDSITVYSLPDHIANGSQAIPIKTIHFLYNYSLCEKVENGAGGEGKLTLDKVSFTYEKSRKGFHSPYVFRYGMRPDGSISNPEYSIRDVNRWGYFQENKGLSDYYNNPLDPNVNLSDRVLSNIDYPYASQDKTEMDKNAYAWNLTDITIPGGGKIRVNYEAHEYAFIQDKVAGQMFQISGVEHTGETSLYEGSKVYFNPGTFNNPATEEELFKRFIRDIYPDGFLYYKVYVNLKDDLYEYITGYAKVKGYGLENGNPYLDLVEADLDDERANGSCNPILKNALQFLRINRNNLIYSTSPPDPAGLSDFASQLPDILYQLSSQIEAAGDGVNFYCRKNGFCENIDLSRSFIRLYIPDSTKLAGGSRVRSVSIGDNWQEMAGGAYQNKAYTTYYDYTAREWIDPITGDTLCKYSSGVADYEPMLGGDEISLKQPIFYSDKKKKAPDTEYFVETPVNESSFPSPQITYSRVTRVTNPTNEDVGKTGRIINEFYTARDYPVKVKYTTIDEARDKTEFNSFQFPFIASDQQHDFATVTQGFSIELNNLSGLPKATWVYNEHGDRVSGEETKYSQTNDNFTTIDCNGHIHTGVKMGLSVDYALDGRESYDRSQTDVSQLNLNISLVGPLTVPLFVPLFSTMVEEKQFRSFVVNKVIHRNALLERKTIYSQTASITTENLAYDEVTGEAILTRTFNEFNDTLYSFKYPAYWMYNGMGPAYRNTKLAVTPGTLNDLKSFLKPGDELMSTTTGDRVWYMGPGSGFEDEHKNVALVSGSNWKYQVYSSGAKNLLTASAGEVVTWNYNPLQGDAIRFTSADPIRKTVLNSSAIEYADTAVVYCDTCRPVFHTCRINEYLSGQNGNWKPKRTWFYLTNRTPDDLTNGITDIRKEGLFDTYSDFWVRHENLNPPGWEWRLDSNNWEWKEKVNLVDVDGMTIELEDRIGRKVSSLLGYKNSLITAQAFNASYHESYFDGFEDYLFSYCIAPVDLSHVEELNRVRISSGSVMIEDRESHTGNYSLNVNVPVVFTQKSPYIFHSSDEKLCAGCIGGFWPEKNKSYLLSCWVKVNSPPPVLSCNSSYVQVSCSGSTPVVLRSEGPVIEGWQRIQGTFKTGLNDNSVTVTLNPGSAETFFDDIRILPDSGNMVSYVYDDSNLRLTNILDENNYFTRYEYNNQGELIRIKKESERGIFDIKESNQALTKKP